MFTNAGLARTAVERVYLEIKGRIIHGQLSPGEKVDQDELTAALEVSRIPVRTALERLASEGWVELHPHRGAVVKQLTADEIQQIYAIRLALEPWAVEQACPLLSPADLDQLHTELEQAARCIVNLDFDGYAAAGRRFHDAIRAVMKNPELQQICANLWERTQRYRWVYIQEHAMEALNQNRALLEHLRARDAMAAGAQMRILLVHARRKVMESI